MNWLLNELVQIKRTTNNVIGLVVSDKVYNQPQCSEKLYENIKETVLFL